MNVTPPIGEEASAHAELERRYRFLLRAYPGGYRRANSEEILATLMDTAAPGQRRPVRADVADLLRGAVRQWFRPPVGAGPKLASALAGLILAAIGAAGASWLAWQVAAKIPSDPAAVRIGATVTGASLIPTSVDRVDGPRDVRRSVTVYYRTRTPGWTLQSAQNRLQADGWTMDGGVERIDWDYVQADGVRHTGFEQRFHAYRDGQLMTGRATTSTTPGEAGTRVLISISAAESPGTSAATAVGWLCGALAGWLLAVRAGQRLRRRHLAYRVAALLLAVLAVGLAARPALGVYRNIVRLTFTNVDLYEEPALYRWVVTSPTAWLIAATLLVGALILLLAGVGSSQSKPTTASAA